MPPAMVKTKGLSTPIQQKVIDGVNGCLEKNEQNLNENTLVCSAPAVADLLRPSSTGDSPNLEQLKGEVCRTMCGEDVTSINVGNLKLSVYMVGTKSTSVFYARNFSQNYIC